MAYARSAVSSQQIIVMQGFVDPEAFSPDEVVDAVQTIAISIFAGGAGS